MTMKTAARVVLALATAAGASTAFPAKKITCWTDANGRRVCGDSIPPDNAGSQRTVIDAQGRTQVIPAAPTPEERAAQEAAAREAAEAKRIADQAAANDRSLLATYSKPQDIAALRDDRLATLDANARLTAKGIERDQAELDEMRAALPTTDATNTKDPKTLKKIAEFDAELAEKRRVLADMGAKRSKICATADRDIRRFQELKSGQATYQSPCPAPDSLGTADVEADLNAARKAFTGFAAQHTARAPGVFGGYAPDAVVRYLYPAASGKQETAELSLDDYRKEATADWQKLKPGTPGPVFSEVNVEDAKGGAAKVTAKVDGKKFWVLMKPAGGGKWLVTEQWAEAKF
jgi:hypothetical protein